MLKKRFKECCAYICMYIYMNDAITLQKRILVRNWDGIPTHHLNVGLSTHVAPNWQPSYNHDGKYLPILRVERINMLFYCVQWCLLFQVIQCNVALYAWCKFLPSKAQLFPLTNRRLVLCFVANAWNFKVTVPRNSN